MSETESKALTVIERATLALGLAEIEKTLTELASKTTDIVAITNNDGYEQVHSSRMALKNQRVAIQKAGKAARDDATKFGKAVLAEENRLIAIIEPEETRLQALQDAHDAAAEAAKQKRIDDEIARVAALQERVTYLGGNSSLTSLTDPALLAEHISDLQGEIVDESFEEYRERADAAKATGIARLQALHAASIERVAEAARIKGEREELVRLREQQEARDKTERERIAAEDKAAKEKRDAELAELRATQVKAQAVIDENNRVAAENKAESDRLSAQRAELDKRANESQSGGGGIPSAGEKSESQGFDHRGFTLAGTANEESLANSSPAVDPSSTVGSARLAEDSAERRSPVANCSATPDEGNRQSRLVVRPSDEEIIDVLAIHYNAPAARVVEWILAIDFSSEQLKELAAA